MRLPNPSLLVVTDRNQASLPLTDLAEQCFAAGCRWLSLREKDLTANEQIVLAKSLIPIVRRWHAMLTIHGTPDIAIAAGTDGVHLASGSDGIAARKAMGPGALIGVSVHSVDEVVSLDPSVIDYAIVGPAYETASKPGYGPALGAVGIAAIARAARVPILAIGGITAANTPALIWNGTVGIAVMGGVMRVADPREYIVGLLEAMAYPTNRKH